MTENTFPCPACGAPLAPQPDRIRVSCVYCGSQATIPDHLRSKSQPQKPANFEPAQTQKPHPEEQLADALRKAQPVAHKALNTFWLWSLVRRIAPGCIVTFSILCALSCAIAFLLIYYARSGP